MYTTFSRGRWLKQRYRTDERLRDYHCCFLGKEIDHYAHDSSRHVSKGARQVPTTAGFRPPRFPPHYLHIISSTMVNDETLSAAITDLRNQKTFNYNATAKKYNINKTTLHQQFKSK